MFSHHPQMRLWRLKVRTFHTFIYEFMKLQILFRIYSHDDDDSDEIC